MVDIEKIKQKIKVALLNNHATFNDKVIHTIDSEYQSYSYKLSVLIPVKHPVVNDRFVKLEEPSMTEEEALDMWLDKLLGEK